MIPYSAVLDVPWELFWFVHSLIHQHREQTGGREGVRVLSVYAQTELVLRRLRDRPSYADLARDFKVSRATARRHGAAGIAILAEHAPDPRDLIKQALDEDWTRFIVDGTLVPGPRMAAKADEHRAAVRLAEARGEQAPESGKRAVADGDLEVDPESLNTDKPLSKTKIDLIEGSFRAAWGYDPNHSGRHHQTGMNVQYVCGPSGRADFVSEAMTGRTHDSEAAEAADLDVAFADLDIPVPSDLAYVRSSTVHGLI